MDSECLGEFGRLGMPGQPSYSVSQPRAEDTWFQSVRHSAGSFFSCFRDSFLQPSLNCPNLVAVKQKATPEFEVLEGRCAGPLVCPLSRVKAGAVVCIKQLSAAPEVTSRLRELGFCEDQKIKLVARQSNYICQVCNARLAISGRLADSIMVETVPAPLPKA
jgi:Fe2+ transport system protein FeoA